MGVEVGVDDSCGTFESLRNERKPPSDEVMGASAAVVVPAAAVDESGVTSASFCSFQFHSGAWSVN